MAAETHAGIVDDARTYTVEALARIHKRERRWATDFINKHGIPRIPAGRGITIVTGYHWRLGLEAAAECPEDNHESESMS